MLNMASLFNILMFRRCWWVRKRQQVVSCEIMPPYREDEREHSSVTDVMWQELCVGCYERLCHHMSQGHRAMAQVTCDS